MRVKYRVFYLKIFGWWTHSNVDTSRDSIRKARVSKRPLSTTFIATLSSIIIQKWKQNKRHYCQCYGYWCYCCCHRFYTCVKWPLFDYTFHFDSILLVTSGQLMYGQFDTRKIASPDIPTKSVETNSPAQCNLQKNAKKKKTQLE